MHMNNCWAEKWQSLDIFGWIVGYNAEKNQLPPKHHRTKNWPFLFPSSEKKNKLFIMFSFAHRINYEYRWLEIRCDWKPIFFSNAGKWWKFSVTSSKNPIHNEQPSKFNQKHQTIWVFFQNDNWKKKHIGTSRQKIMDRKNKLKEQSISHDEFIGSALCRHWSNHHNSYQPLPPSSPSLSS